METMTKTLIDKCFTRVVWITAEPTIVQSRTEVAPAKEALPDTATPSRVLGSLFQRITSLNLLKCVIFIGVLLALHQRASAEEWKMVTDFRGDWKFKLGDNARWADPKFNDSKWDEIFVPANWEDEGYPGYDGYAWYRKHFRFSEDLRDKPVYIHIGCVDDVSEVYLNGHFISFTGAFPPHFITAYNVEEKFPVPMEYVNFNGDNVIAVRVYDDQQYGGINRGKPGVFILEDYLYPDFPITGTWKLQTGDDDDWAKPSFDDSDWKDVLVPAYWETQGHKDYDGVGWYRIHFTVPEKYRDQDLVLLVGKVDDVDETYLNGERVGRTGSRNHVRGGEYLKLRAYTVPSEFIKCGQTNVLAVRVYDNYLHGGIYDGPIGFISRDRFRKWERKHESRDDDDRWNFFDIFK
jgi:Beta-galactosidase jelly roll domain